MAKRQAIYTIPSADVQGEGSWVKVRAITRGQLVELATLAQRYDTLSVEERAQVENQLISDLVVDWNWVDDDGNPLPLPRDHPELIASLPQREVQFLLDAITGETMAKKTSASSVTGSGPAGL